MHYLNKDNSIALLNNLKILLLWGIGFTIAFSLLNLNSICIIGLTGIWLLETLQQRSLAEKLDLLRKDRLFLAFLIYFLVEAASLLYANDFHAGWKNFESKLGFLAFPVIFCSISSKNRIPRGKVLTGFSLSVTAASIFCLIVETKRYFQTHNTGLFFYHDLVSPLDHHAIYFSVFVFISLIYLFLNHDLPGWLRRNNWLRIIWITFYFLLLILLASKMLLLALIPIVIFILYQQNRRKHLKLKTIGICLIASLALAFTAVSSFKNPIRDRFTDLLSTDLGFLRQEKFTPDTYFNGMELRLLLWRFTYEILNEKKAWVNGVSPSDAQPELRKKYLATNMFSGNQTPGNEGYLVFNCHNQFLQTTLQLGLIGLATLLFWWYAIFRKAVRKKDLLLSATAIIIFIFSFSESLFERQYGMILSTFFLLLLSYTEVGKNTKQQVQV